MTDLVVRAGTAITVDGARRVLQDGAVAIEGGRIVEVGDGAEVVARHREAEVLDFPHGIAMPGLVDAHGHAGHSLIRTLGADDLDAWMDACERIYLHGAIPQFWEADARLTAVERLCFGTTTGVSMLGGAGDTIRSDDASHGRAHAVGVGEVGIRDLMVVGPGAPPFPKPTTAASGDRIDSGFDAQLGVVRRLIDEADGRCSMVATTFPTLTLDELQAAAQPEVMECARSLDDLTRRHGLRIVQDGHRGDTVVASDRLGLLHERSLLSHAVDLTDDQISLVAERGASIAHNPSAVFSQYGRCPVIELVEAGVTVAIGSDATAPDRSADMFRHMFQATRYHRAIRRDPAILPPGRVLEMTTIDGAAALGMEDEIGSLEVGKAADLVIVDASAPHLTPLTHPVHQVVYYASGSDVDSVIVDGRILMRGRRVLTVDVEEVREEARREQAAAVARVGLQHLLRPRPGTWGAMRYPG